MSQRHSFSCPLEGRTKKRLVVNPETGRCILATGSTAQRLKEQGLSLQPWKRTQSRSRKSQSKSPSRGNARQPKAAAVSHGPKRPPTAFVMFMMDHREEIQKRFPNISFGDIAVETSKLWKAAPKSVKDRYLDLYKMARDKYERALGKDVTQKPRARPRYNSRTFEDTSEKKSHYIDTLPVCDETFSNRPCRYVRWPGMDMSKLKGKNGRLVFRDGTPANARGIIDYADPDFINFRGDERNYDPHGLILELS